MRVVVSVHGRYHGFDLANELRGAGVLARLLTTYPAPVARRFLVPGVQLHTAPMLELRRRFHGRFGIGAKPDVSISQAFARFVLKKGIANTDVLVGWSSALLEAIRPAQAEGVKVVVERGSSHIVHQTEVLRREYEAFGLTPDLADPRMIERELAEYEAADAIAVPTAFAAETFMKQGIERKRLIINPYGVDLTRFAPAERPVRDKPLILFVGRVGLRKGIPHLLRAFKQLKGRAELKIVGPLEAGIEDIIAREGGDGVTVTGPVPGDALPALYAEADIFCLPSLEEGFALVLLQAMAAGLPIVTTDAAGGAEAVATGAEGIIVPSGDDVSLAEALDQLVNDRDRRHAMGGAARERAQTGFSWRDYGARAVRAYRSLTA